MPNPTPMHNRTPGQIPGSAPNHGVGGAVPDLGALAARAKAADAVQSQIAAAPQFNYDDATWFDRFDTLSRNALGTINQAKMALMAGDAQGVMVLTAIAQAEIGFAGLCVKAHALTGDATPHQSEHTARLRAYEAEMAGLRMKAEAVE